MAQKHTTNPQPGALYVARWGTRRYPVMVLPMRGDLSVAGIEGTLEETPLYDPVRGCYSHAGESITVQEHCEDDAPRKVAQFHPVRWFDRGKKCHVDWLRAEDLFPFQDYKPPARMKRYFTQAKKQRFHGMLGPARRPNQEQKREGGRLVRHGQRHASSCSVQAKN